VDAPSIDAFKSRSVYILGITELAFSWTSPLRHRPYWSDDLPVTVKLQEVNYNCLHVNIIRDRPLFRQYSLPGCKHMFIRDL